MPVNVNSTVVMIVNSSTGNLVTTFTTELTLISGLVSHGIFNVATLTPGSYSGIIYVLSSSGVVISPESTFTFTIQQS